jgi:hypothetical protein
MQPAPLRAALALVVVAHAAAFSSRVQIAVKLPAPTQRAAVPCPQSGGAIALRLRPHGPARRNIAAIGTTTQAATGRSGGVRTLDFDNVAERELGTDLLDRLEQMEGIWFSDDFYGPHGREWVDVSTTLVGASAASSLVAVKVSGDANVPSGCVTWRTRGLPDVGGGSVPAEVQIRADASDPNGFSWVPASLVLVCEDRIALTVVWPGSIAFTGTFHKHKVGEGA